MDDGGIAVNASAAEKQAPAASAQAASGHQDTGQDTGVAGDLDRLIHAFEGHVTGSVSPTIISLALADWLMHLGNAPGKRLDLAIKAWEASLETVADTGRLSFGEEVEGRRRDARFAALDWNSSPFSLLRNTYLRWEDWWQEACSGIAGVKSSHERVVSFMMRQLLEACSPANYPLSNPEIVRATVDSNGANLMRGLSNLLEDVRGLQNATPAKPALKAGKDLAVTPGRVVFRNEMIELIQYAPTTDTVCAEPILLIPAWIMKYYILDLAPQNSLVRYLVGQGHTVFMISWRNPGPDQRHWGMEDYRVSGISAALDAIGEIVPGRAVHACGYCLGGTLLAIEAARLARDGDPRLATLSFFAAQTDFTEAGEIKVFTSEDQVAFLDDITWQRGYLDGAEMAGAFQLLRPGDLIWARMVRQYFLGERDGGTDLTSWNSDLTRLPHRMHAEYLRRLFVNNELAQGHFLVDGRPVALSDIRQPVFAVGTETDHIAPWRSVYKIKLLSRAQVTFVLTKGGHNAGIVSEPGHAHRHFRLEVAGPEDRFVDPDSWYERTAIHEGSWWPAWVDWLREHSSEDDIPARAVRPGLCAAPGTYVLGA
ncbi:PHA/PHB synthase family protein [Dongia sp.]|uniref:PHA/PHB synthase family protein n=1 Tax=Dongia sp. TaxID=1977262 RepID=UPI0035AFB365